MTARRIALAVAAALALAGAALAQQEIIRSSLEKAKAGQYARYKLAADIESRQSIVKVDGKKVTVKFELFRKGKLLSSNETVRDLEKKPDPKAAPPAKLSDDTVEINGQSLKCKVWENEKEKIWLCSDVPCEGFVQVEKAGKKVQELISWGDDVATDPKR
jgi:hypothetical protein